MEITVGEQMEKILDDYSKEVRRATANSMDVVAKEGVQKLKNTSPKQTKHRRKYAEGWAIKRKKTSTGVPEVTIYNKNAPQLTHLLENGHDVYNDSFGPMLGRANGIKHIGPVNDWACDELPREIERELKK
jgi:hypothetical protein